MSYTIIYNHLTLKVGENMFIPFIEAGPNNVRDNGGRRPRSWQRAGFLDLPDSFVTSPEQIESVFDSWFASTKDRAALDEEDTTNIDFGYYTAITFSHRKINTFGQAKALFRNSCLCSSITFEYLSSHGQALYVSIAEGHNYYCRSEEEFSAVMASALLMGVNNPPEIRITSIEHIASCIKCDNQNKRRANKSTASRVEQDHYFALILKDQNRYFVRKRKYGYTYSYDYRHHRVKSFRNEHAATKWLKKRGLDSDGWTAKRVEYPRSFSVATTHAI